MLVMIRSGSTPDDSSAGKEVALTAGPGFIGSCYYESFHGGTVPIKGGGSAMNKGGSTLVDT